MNLQVTRSWMAARDARAQMVAVALCALEWLRGPGLAIVRTIMELHGDTVHAESDTSSTRFILDFPRR
jgi:hypothetical protein